jgi:GTP-binding protein
MPDTSASSSLPIRNVAIIAHVDHGKTTLVDQLLKQSGMFRAGELEKLAGGQHDLIMDSNELERERGITILSKNCAVNYHAADGLDYRINIIDTPGHADFGGEVERVLRMADGCLLLVDALEGPMPQTKFVLTKALEAGLKPVVVVNKVDRPNARPHQVVVEVFELLFELGADDHALDFKTIFCSGRDGWAVMELHDTDPFPTSGDLAAVFETIVKEVPAPKDDPSAPLQTLITTLDYNDYVGRIGIGRVFAGVLKVGQPVMVIKRDGKQVRSRTQKLLQFQGLKRVEVSEVSAGDLCAIVGLESVDIGDTIADPENPKALIPVKIDEPTMTMLFRINDSPFAGQEGTYVTSRQIRDRLMRELEKNVALRVESGRTSDEFIVSGRGVLHLGILLETYAPRGLRAFDRKARGHHPRDRRCGVRADRGARHRCAQLDGRQSDGARRRPQGRSEKDGAPRRQHHAPRLRDPRPRPHRPPRQTAHRHAGRGDHAPHVPQVRAGDERAAAQAHGCADLHRVRLRHRVRGGRPARPRRPLRRPRRPGLRRPGHRRTQPRQRPDVNITRLKHLTNIRNANKEQTVTLKAPRKLSLEEYIEYVEDDELIEVTPGPIRLRKRIMDESMRRKAERSARDKAEAAS